MAGAAAVDEEQRPADKQRVPGSSEKFLKKDQVAAMLSGSGHGSGWRVLRDGEDADVVPSARDDKDPVSALDPIELRESGSSRGQGAGEDEDGVVPDRDGSGVVVYKVYKRRWFGLVQLVLLNIIVSIDVSPRSPITTILGPMCMELRIRQCNATHSLLYSHTRTLANNIS